MPVPPHRLAATDSSRVQHFDTSLPTLPWKVVVDRSASVVYRLFRIIIVIIDNLLLTLVLIICYYY